MHTMLTFGVLLATIVAPALANDRYTMLVDLKGQEVEGMPLAWSSKQVFLLGRDGKLWDFAPNDAQRFRKTSSYFSSYSAAEIRAGLIRELGGRLEVTGTGHYLVAHPRGKEAWAARFEDLYRSCVHYFTQRGMQLTEPEFPLVAIVWGSREDFLHYSAAQGTQVRSDVLGYYSPTTNRVTLYDQGAGVTNQRTWLQNEATIIHEATHQVAFNTGVHNRFSSTPKWLVEGLGTMFEARGVWDWINHPGLNERINRPRLAQFQAWSAAGRKSGAFVNLIGSDRQFQTNPSAAYAESWAWVLFLTETYPQKFSEYVQRVARRPRFQEYPLARRMADFTAVFGDDLRTLERHFQTFIDSLR
ncbi:MAG TPA: DUF1570 domain-containing protein [Pirellulales bacterium]|nr:DUF1570 domain-containing protein [Pirellulales bacterium]